MIVLKGVKLIKYLQKYSFYSFYNKSKHLKQQ